jgi:hypothetical protein
MRATGHVKLVHRKRGPVYYLKYRHPDGHQVERKLGPAWPGKGRPTAGSYTRHMADEALQEILVELRRGTPLDRPRVGATFADAAAEWLRYVEHDRQRRPSTVRDYRNTTEARLIPEFGSDSIDAITPDRVDRW